MLNQNRKLKDWIYKRITLGYFVGPYLENAISACGKIEDLGWASTICPWNSSGDAPSKVNQGQNASIISQGEAVELLLVNQGSCYGL